MTTIAENIQNKSATIHRWKEANPGLSWSNPERSKGNVIYIGKDLLNSKAYRSLSRCALLVYQDFLAKRDMGYARSSKAWFVKNNGEIVYPYLEAEQRGFNRKQFRNAIDELQQKGLIDIKHLGKGGRKTAKGAGDASTYWLDDRWEKYGTPDFKPARNPRVKDTRKSIGWKLINSDPDMKKAVEQKRKEAIKTKVGCRKRHQLAPNRCRNEHQLRSGVLKQKNG